MTKFNPDFWEVTVSEETWEQFTIEDSLCYEDPEEAEKRYERAELAESLLPTIRTIMDEILSPRQHEIIEFYFFNGLNQREIAKKLSISQQSVSEHLYGKVRNGRAIGGALRKLRKVCIKRGVLWP